MNTSTACVESARSSPEVVAREPPLILRDERRFFLFIYRKYPPCLYRHVGGFFYAWYLFEYDIE